MNDIGGVSLEMRPTLILYRLQLDRSLCSNGGTETSGLDKPLDSEGHKKLREL